MTQVLFDQNHLNYSQRINLGAYYTDAQNVSRIYNLIRKNVSGISKYCILDTSCGYGSFFSESILSARKIGADIDINAVNKAKASFAGIDFFCRDSLRGVKRSAFNLSETDKIIIVGNPPYNDMTSIIRNNVKENKIRQIDADLKTRDLGMSFLLSYNKLRADYICILHPLSYLIKKSNFTALGDFTRNYKLIDSLIISSGEFSQTSKSISFPILISLYERSLLGMDYEFIRHYEFKTKEGKSFKLSDFDFISNYVSKYPNRNFISAQETSAKFWAIRDINALKRNRTFIESDCDNAVFVTEDKLDYYCYIDAFKRRSRHIPYYFGNCDIMIDNNSFLKIRSLFRYDSIKNNPALKGKFILPSAEGYPLRIEEYFQKLLGGHYVL